MRPRPSHPTFSPVSHGALSTTLNPSASHWAIKSPFNSPSPSKQRFQIGDRRSAIVDVSRISHNISPHILEEYGLITALNNFINQIRITDKITFVTDFEKLNRFDLKTELTIYRTINELINNTIKHAFADIITIKMYVSGNVINIDYTDNGKGFDLKKTEQNKKGMGLNNMQNRVNSLNGNISINSSENKGITVLISLPYFENEY